MTAKTLASIQRLKIVEMFGPLYLKLREGKEPAKTAVLLRSRLEGKRKVAFHTITDCTLLHVLSRNYK